MCFIISSKEPYFILNSLIFFIFYLDTNNIGEVGFLTHTCQKCHHWVELETIDLQVKRPFFIGLDPIDNSTQKKKKNKKFNQHLTN